MKICYNKMTYKCEICKSEFKKKSGLNYHVKTAGYCLKLRGNEILSFECSICNLKYSSHGNLQKHFIQCSSHIGYKKYEKLYTDEKVKRETQQEIYLKQIEDRDKLIETLRSDIESLRRDLQELSLEAIKRPYNVTNNTHYDECDECVIEIEKPDMCEDDKGSNDEYQLKPLEVGNGYIIENREEDNYINVTNLCKAGDKKFNDWKRTDRTKAFLQVLSSTTNIPALELMKYNTGGNGERHTWVHPQVAINIAQWISPEFDVKVSAWIYEVMMTGKIDISNTKSYRELQKENKDKQLKIQYLTKKYVKRQPRKQFEESNVMYILTTERLKKDKIYVLGKANNLTTRLSTYNKTDEHEVIFYKQCKDEKTLSLVENMVFDKLEKYRETANRERFILPENADIKMFINVIQNCVDFMK